MDYLMDFAVRRTVRTLLLYRVWNHEQVALEADNARGHGVNYENSTWSSIQYLHCQRKLWNELVYHGAGKW